MFRAFDIFDQYATDPNKELNGVWVPIGPMQEYDENDKPVPGSEPYVKVARSGNRRHGRVVSQLWEASEDILKGKNKDAADDKGEEVTIEAMAQGILLGWKNLVVKGERLQDAGTEDSKMDPETRLTTARGLLKIKDFRDMVNKHANEREKYLLKQEADAAKN